MKSLIVVLSLLLAYTPIAGAQEYNDDEFDTESKVENLVDDLPEMTENTTRSARDSIGEIVILEGAGNVAVAKYIPNPEEYDTMDDNTAEENDSGNIEEEVANLPSDEETEVREIVTETPDVDEVQSEPEVLIPVEDIQNDEAQNSFSEENPETAEAGTSDESAEQSTIAEDETPRENIEAEEVVIMTGETTEKTDKSSTDDEQNSVFASQGETESAVMEESPVVTEEVTAVIEEEPEDDGKTKEEYDEEISYYIKNMNLSVEQLDMAKYISSDSRLKMDQLLKSIYLLRAQARELEEKSLNDFEAILTEEQKEQFHKLRATQEKSRKKFEVFDVKAMEEDDANQAEDVSGDAENKPAE